MKKVKGFLLALFMTAACGVHSASAQIYVNVRPHAPRYERVEAHRPGHVFIREEWEPRGNTYTFTGGRWVEPPHDGDEWIPGHWRHTYHGWAWIPGHWRD